VHAISDRYGNGELVAAAGTLGMVNNRSNRSAYVALASAKLIEIQGKVFIVRAILRREIAKGNSVDSQQLLRLRHQMNFFMLAAQRQLKELKKADNEDWHAARDSFNNAWEDVAHSIKLAIAKFR